MNKRNWNSFGENISASTRSSYRLAHRPFPSRGRQTRRRFGLEVSTSTTCRFYKANLRRITERRQGSNSNGQSDSGKVLPVGAFGIEKLSIDGRTLASGDIININGATLRNGTTRPTVPNLPRPGPRSALGFLGSVAPENESNEASCRSLSSITATR